MRIFFPIWNKSRSFKERSDHVHIFDILITPQLNTPFFIYSVRFSMAFFFARCLSVRMCANIGIASHASYIPKRRPSVHPSGNYKSRWITCDMSSISINIASFSWIALCVGVSYIIYEIALGHSARTTTFVCMVCTHDTHIPPSPEALSVTTVM